MRGKNMPKVTPTPGDAAAEVNGWLKGQDKRYQPRRDYGAPSHASADVNGIGEGEQTPFAGQKGIMPEEGKRKDLYEDDPDRFKP